MFALTLGLYRDRIPGTVDSHFENLASCEDFLENWRVSIDQTATADPPFSTNFKRQKQAAAICWCIGGGAVAIELLLEWLVD
jgi:hypothetical protein